MKRLLIALFVAVALICLANIIAFEDVPAAVIEEQLDEVERVAMPINSINFDDTNYLDLKHLDTILEGVRIVMLGERTHQDGQTFVAKSRLIRYLHERLGYRVVLYEAGQFDMWMMNQTMESSDADGLGVSVGGIGLFDFWWANEETKPLIDYYLASKKTPSPIELGGFDIQFTGSLLNERRSRLIREFLQKNEIDLQDYAIVNDHVDDLPRLAYNMIANRRLDADQKSRFLQDLRHLERAVSQLEPTEENTMYQRYFNDVRHNLRKSWSFETGSEESMNFRDSLMAQNLIYQIDSLYTNQKVVIWCSNIHTFSRRYSKAYRPMGAYIKEKYADASYMLNFTSFAREDSKGNLVDKPGKFAVENVFHRRNLPYFMIDLRGLSVNTFLKDEFVSNLNQGIDEEKAWTHYIDGIFYIDINQNPTYPEE